jgi:L-ascorbate metabolism protein UlaG (beta-lactamase superfamily)
MRKYLIAGAVGVVAIISALFLIRIDACPEPVPLRNYFVNLFSPSPMRITFLGVSSLLIEDDTQAVVIDGFFTRPTLFEGLAAALTPVEPNGALIDAALQRAEITTVTAPAQTRRLNLLGVVVNHSHYDHAMDSSDVAERTGAMLIGSESTANIARGRMFPDARIKVIAAAEHFCLDRFRIGAVPTGHVMENARPIPLAGQITEPLVPRAINLPLRNIHLTRGNRVDEYKEGGTFAIFVQYRGIGKRVLVQGSAGFQPGALQGHRAAVVYLAVGLLSRASQAHVDGYWSEVVGTVLPRRIVPIHWDDLLAPAPLSESLAPSPEGDAGIAIVNGKAGGIEVSAPTVWRKVDPFEGFPVFVLR